MKLFYTQVRRLVLLSGIILFCSNLFGQTNTWNGSGGNNWTTASSWSLNAVPTAAHDVLINIGGTFTIADIPTTTILKLRITNNTNVTLLCNNAGSRIITVTSATVDAIDVDAGSTLQLQGIRQGGPANQYSLTLTTANTVGLEANIDGTLIVKRNGNDLLTNGIFTKGGTNAIINFHSGSLYTHNVEAVAIPISNWNINSTCNVTGVTATAPVNLNQAFGNFTWNCSHTAPINLAGALTTINGSFNVSRTGISNGNSGRVNNGLTLCTSGAYTLNVGVDLNITNPLTESSWLILTDGNANATINVLGNFNMSGPNNTTFFDYKYGIATTIGTLVLNITGNYNQSGGYFDWAFQTNGGATYTTMNLTGNFTMTGASVMLTGTTTATMFNGKIVFNKAGAQTISASTPGNLAYTNFEVLSGSTLEMLSTLYVYSSANAPWAGQFIVNTGAILDMNTNQLLSSVAPGTNNGFTLNSGAGVITAHANGLQNAAIGSVSASIANRIFSSGANYTYDGIIIQNSGIFLTSLAANTVNNLTINNSGGTTGVTLEQAIAVNGVLTLSNGLLTTTSALLLTINAGASVAGQNYATRVAGGSEASYVNPIMRKIGNTDFLFPVGKLGAGYHFAGVSAPANGLSHTFTVEYIRGPAHSPAPLNSITSAGPPPLLNVSHCEYWTIDRTSGASDVGIILSWTSNSNCSPVTYVSDPNSLVVAHHNGTSWNNHGRTSTTGTFSAGTILWSGLTGGFNTANTPFSLGSIDALQNPLPIKLTSINAYKIQGGNKVEWSNLTEQGVNIYELEKSADGRTFDVVNAQQAKKNNGSKADYNWIDVNPFSSITYYRIRAIERTGNVLYSPVVKVQTGGNIKDGFIVYPNPVIAKQFTVQLSSPAGVYKIKLINNFGQEIMTTQWQHLGGSASKTIELNPSVSAGVYHLQITGGNQIMQSKILIQ